MGMERHFRGVRQRSAKDKEDDRLLKVLDVFSLADPPLSSPCINRKHSAATALTYCGIINIIYCFANEDIF